MTAEETEDMRQVRELGRELRGSLAAYRRAFTEATRRAAAGRTTSAAESHADFELLRADWEQTLGDFREAVDRIGTSLKTLGRG